LVTAVESKKARGVPDIFIFKNDTKPIFEADEEGDGAKTERDLAQWKALIAFIKEWCEREQDGQRVFTAALNWYQALDQFEQVLEKLLLGKLNERFPPASDPSVQLTAHPPGAKALVDAFVAARLLVVEKSKADYQKAEVTVAHEALFEHWAALKNLLLAERDDLILPRARVAGSQERWRVENQATDFLLPPGKQLSEAEQLLSEYGKEFTPDLKDYIETSVTERQLQLQREHDAAIAAERRAREVAKFAPDATW
jgi:hypothetical protein